MELTEALAIVQNVKNRYQAFEHLEDAIQVVVNADRQHAATLVRLKQLEKEVSRTEADLSKLRETIKADELAASHRHDDAEQKHKERLLEMEVEASNKEKKLFENHEATRVRLEQIISNLDSERQALSATMDTLQKKHTDLMEAHEALKRKLA